MSRQDIRIFFIIFTFFNIYFQVIDIFSMSIYSLYIMVNQNVLWRENICGTLSKQTIQIFNAGIMLHQPLRRDQQ